MKTLDQIKTALDNICDTELVSIWNEYQREVSGGYELYDFDNEFFEIFFEGKPQECARAVFFGNVQYWGDDYIYFNAYGNLESTNNPATIVDYNELAEYIHEHESDFSDLLDTIED